MVRPLHLKGRRPCQKLIVKFACPLQAWQVALTFTCHMARGRIEQQTTGDTWPANSCSAQWVGEGGEGLERNGGGGYVVGRCIKQKQSKSMACKQCHTTRAPVTIFHHMSTCPHPSLCVRMYCIPSLNLSTSTCIDYPDSEVSNMSPVGTDLSRFCRCTGSAHSLPPCSTQHLT